MLTVSLRGSRRRSEELIEETEELIEDAQDTFKEFQKEAKKANRGEESNLKRPESPGLGGRDDDGDDDDDDANGNGRNITTSSAASGRRASNDIAEELEKLATVISRIRNRLGGLSTNVNATDVGRLIEEAQAHMEKAKALAGENPDESEDHIEAAEELVEDALDLLEDLTNDDVDGVEAFEPDDDDDDDQEDDDDEDPDRDVEGNTNGNSEPEITA